MGRLPFGGLTRASEEWIGPANGRGRPSHEEALRVARQLLVGIPDTFHLDIEGEFQAVVQVLTFLLS